MLKQPREAVYLFESLKQGDVLSAIYSLIGFLKNDNIKRIVGGNTEELSQYLINAVKLPSADLNKNFELSLMDGKFLSKISEQIEIAATKAKLEHQLAEKEKELEAKQDQLRKAIEEKDIDFVLMREYGIRCEFSEDTIKEVIPDDGYYQRIQEIEEKLRGRHNENLSQANQKIKDVIELNFNGLFSLFKSLKEKGVIELQVQDINKELKEHIWQKDENKSCIPKEQRDKIRGTVLFDAERWFANKVIYPVDEKIAELKTQIDALAAGKLLLQQEAQVEINDFAQNSQEQWQEQEQLQEFSKLAPIFAKIQKADFSDIYLIGELTNKESDYPEMVSKFNEYVQNFAKDQSKGLDISDSAYQAKLFIKNTQYLMQANKGFAESLQAYSEEFNKKIDSQKEAIKGLLKVLGETSFVNMLSELEKLKKRNIDVKSYKALYMLKNIADYFNLSSSETLRDSLDHDVIRCAIESLGIIKAEKGDLEIFAKLLKDNPRKLKKLTKFLINLANACEEQNKEQLESKFRKVQEAVDSLNLQDQNQKDILLFNAVNMVFAGNLSKDMIYSAPLVIGQENITKDLRRVAGQGGVDNQGFQKIGEGDQYDLSAELLRMLEMKQKKEQIYFQRDAEGFLELEGSARELDLGDIKNCKVTNGIIKQATASELINVTFKNVTLKNTSFKYKDPHEKELGISNNSDFVKQHKVIEFENTKFENVKFEGNISFEGAMFDATSIESLMKAFQKAREQDKNLKINLDEISLTERVELRGVDFSGASLKNADFMRATNLAGANFEGVDLEGAKFTYDALVAAKTQDNKKVSQELRKGIAEFVINKNELDEQELLDTLTEKPNAATSLYLFRGFAAFAVEKYFRDVSEEEKEDLFARQSDLLFQEVAAKIKEKSGLADVLLKHMSNALMFYQSQEGDDVFQDKTLDDMKSGMSTVVAMLNAYKFAAQEKDKNPSRYVIPFIAMDKIALEIVSERFEGDVIAGLVMEGIREHLCHTMHKIIRDNPSGDIHSFMKNGRFAKLAERLQGYYNDAMILDRSVGALGNWKLDEVILKQQDEKISHAIREFMEQDVNLDRKDINDLNAVSKGVSYLLFGKGSAKNRAEEVEWINNSLQNVFRELKFEDKEFIPAMVVRSDLSGEEIFLEKLDAFIKKTWGKESEEYDRYQKISAEDKDEIGRHFQMYHDDKSGIYKDRDTIESFIAQILGGTYVEKGAKLPNIEYTKKIRKGVNDIVQEINGKLPGKLLREIKDLYYKATWYAYGGLGFITSSVKIRQQNDLKKVELELKNLLRNKIMDRIVSDGEKDSIRKIAAQLNSFYNPSEKEAYKGAKFNAIYSKLLEGFIKAKARGMTDSLDLEENVRDLSGIPDCIMYSKLS